LPFDTQEATNRYHEVCQADLQPTTDTVAPERLEFLEKRIDASGVLQRILPKPLGDEVESVWIEIANVYESRVDTSGGGILLGENCSRARSILEKGGAELYMATAVLVGDVYYNIEAKGENAKAAREIRQYMKERGLIESVEIALAKQRPLAVELSRIEEVAK
jgi:hypothetical protein